MRRALPERVRSCRRRSCRDRTTVRASRGNASAGRRRLSRTCARSCVPGGGTSAGSRIRVDPSLARGLSYYTGAIMEIAVPDLAGSLGGGGRYDNSIGMFLGRDVPACGFSLGLERIIVVMTERSMFPAKVVARRRRRDGDAAGTRRRAPTRWRSPASCARPACASMSIRRPTSWGSSSSTPSSRKVPFVAIVGDDERAQRRSVDQGPADAANSRRSTRERGRRGTWIDQGGKS